MHGSRPKNLNLFTIRFPLAAIVSIFHRLSGFALFLLIPALLWLLQLSLHESGFSALTEWSHSFIVKLIIWVSLMPLCYHFVAGIRHLLSDMHFNNSRRGGRRSAILTFAVSLILIILAGVWLW